MGLTVLWQSGVLDTCTATLEKEASLDSTFHKASHQKVKKNEKAYASVYSLLKVFRININPIALRMAKTP